MRRLVLAASAAIFLMPAFAQAQIDDDMAVTEDLTDDVAVGLNGGIGGFFGNVNELTSTGPAYGVTAGFMSDSPVSYEASFFGHTNGIEGTDSRLSRNQLQATVKAGPQLEAPVAWQPYAFAGIGVGVTTAGSNPYGLSNGLEGIVPVGIGADFFTESAFRVGLRGQYDIALLGGDVAPGDPHPDGFVTSLNAQLAF